MAIIVKALEKTVMVLSGVKLQKTKSSVTSEKGLKSQYFQHFTYDITTHKQPKIFTLYLCKPKRQTFVLLKVYIKKY